MSLWYPPALTDVKFNGAGQFLSGPFRGVLHTTEGSSSAGALATYRKTKSYPHFTVSETQVHQHIPLNLAATALQHPPGTIETNRASAIQIEIVEFTKNSPNMSNLLIRNLANLMHWIEDQTGIRNRFADFTSGRRFSAKEWEIFNGWCGHMHVPNNNHTDPGRIPVNRFSRDKVSPMFNPPLTLEPIVASLKCPTGGVWLLAVSGAIYAWEGAPFKGGANGQAYFAGRKAAQLVADAETARYGHTYTIVASSGERYDY